MKEQIYQKVIDAFRCPINGHEFSVRNCEPNMIYELWYAIISKTLPTQIYANCLIDDDENPMVEPSRDSIDLLYADEDELNSLAEAMLSSRSDKMHLRKDVASKYRSDYPEAKYMENHNSVCGEWIDKIFEDKAGWLSSFHALSKADYPKHYPPSTFATEKEVIAYSASNADVGILLPNFTPELQKEACLEELNRIVYETLRCKNDSKFLSSRYDEFIFTWDQTFGIESFRFSIRYDEIVGAWGGELVNWMVFDITISNTSSFHCYPVLEPPTSDSMYKSESSWGNPLDLASREYFAVTR